MDTNEHAYIALCREQIEARFGFGNGRGYTQRDLVALADRIAEKTGILLSLSTLKRLWKGTFKKSPQPATLDALAILLDYRDWPDFKQHNRLDIVTVSGIDGKKQHGYRRYYRALWLGAALIAVAIAWLFLRRNAGPRAPEILGPVSFTARKTVATGTPATVIFDYDVTNVRADSFFVQQSWNPAHRVSIDPEGKVHTTIYHEAGYHRARLIADDEVIAMQPVHILSDGWETRLYYGSGNQMPTVFTDREITGGGMLHLSRALLQEKHVDLTRPFVTRVSYSYPFGIPSDNFALTSRLRLDSTSKASCPAMQLTVVTERHIFWVNMQQRGCERYASYKIGEIIREGATTDLSALGVNGYAWQELGITVAERQAEITLNGRTLYRETFHDDFGDIMGLLYIFTGTGSLDQVTLTGPGGDAVFEEDFW